MIRTWSRSTPQAELETLLELGEGGMARAYLARALGAGGFQRLVVIKRLNLQLLGVPHAVERFLAEARVAARIHHANVVGTQQIGRDAAGPFIVLDYIEGGSLDDLVSESELPAPIVLRIALDALSGLSAVHEATDVDGRPLAILHRDISLQNILVSAVDGVARLSDFGVAKSTLGKVDTDEGVLVGKLVYFPPEYLRREIVGPPLDLYALGVTLWLALSREEPWHGASDAQIIREILDNGIPPLDAYAKVAPPVAEFVMRACERDPGRRFQSARDMARVLERFDREHGLVASHAEVASLVSDVLGPVLQLRRNAVLRLTRPTDRASTEKKDIASLPTLPVLGGTQRLEALPRPAAIHETRRLAPVVRYVNAVAPARSSRRIVAIGALVAVAVAAGMALVLWGISRGDAAEPAPAAAVDVTVVAPPEALHDPRSVQTKLSDPSRSVELPAPLEADAGRAPQSSETRARGRNEPVNVTREAAGQGTLRKQNPYRRGSTE